MVTVLFEREFATAKIEKLVYVDLTPFALLLDRVYYNLDETKCRSELFGLTYIFVRNFDEKYTY